jgi:hypothetical protein
MKTYILVCIFFSSSILLFGQWSSDPAQNTPIAVSGGEEVIPKIATSENGNTYISWFSNESGNYNVRLQKLDVFGNIQWDSAGLLVSDHEAMSWLTDWDMTIDHEECAILTFQDIRNNGNNDVFAYRISPDGEFLWGEDGIEMSTGPAFDAAPKVAVTNSGNAVFAWQADNVVIIQKISPDGNKLWGEAGITLSGSNTYSWPQVLAVGNDDVILKYFEDSGPPNAPTRHVFAQRYDADGNTVWSQPTVISDAAGISAWTKVFPFINDQNDGFYIAWHDDRDMNNQSSIFVQRIGSDGSVIFQDDGAEATTNTMRNHFDAHLALPTGSENIYVYWYETNMAQNNWGIYGQKLSSTGQRMWTDNGKSFIDVSTTYVNPIAARNSDSDMIVLYEESNTAMDAGILAMRIDTAGNFVWEDEIVDMCTVLSSKVHPDVNQLMSGQWISVWEDNRSGNKDIYAQNIQLDGTLGPVTPGEIEVYPDTLFFEENPQTHQIFIVNNTFESYTITDIDQMGMYFWMVIPYPSLPYELDSGDELVLNVYFEHITDNPAFGYIYEPLHIMSESDTHQVIISINEDLLIGLIKKRSNQISIYPNPAGDFVIFNLYPKHKMQSKLFIFNSFGQVVKSFSSVNKAAIRWDLSDDHDHKVPPGTYFYRLYTSQLIESGKIIVIN